MFDKLWEIVWTWVREQWGFISAVPVPFAVCVLVVSIFAAYVVYLFLDSRYSERIAVLQATVQFQTEQLTGYRSKPSDSSFHVETEPKMMLSMSGGNVFVPDAPDVRDRLTGIQITAQLWNVGSPSVATEWSLIVVPQGMLPVIAQLITIPELLRASGPINSAVIHGSNALDKRTKATPVRDQIVEGPLLFYASLPQAVVMDPHTRLELTVKDVLGRPTTTTKVMGDWLQR
jgi:hypothetical protein